jgi:RNA polymerase sigma-70 factor (ECF subfamily)
MNRQAAYDPFLSLLQNIARGDRKAFAELYEATHHRISVYLYRLVRDQDLIEDILVETYTEVWKNSATFKGRSQVVTWIIGIARNIAFKEIRKRNWHEDIAQHGEIEAKGIDIDSMERRELMQQAMDTLSIKHREILDLVFFQDLSYREVGTLIAIPENTVKTRVYHAKAALKKALAAMGINEGDV